MIRTPTPRRWLAALAAALVCLATAGPAPAQDKVTVRLHWRHQAQFAGLYMAQDLGLYRQAGLDVTIKPYEGPNSPLQELIDGSCDFTTAWLTEAMVKASEGAPIVNLAQVIQRSSLMLVVFTDSGIKDLWDLNNKRVGLWGEHFAVAPRALFRRLGLSLTEVDQSVSMAPFLYRAVDAAMAMRYNEYHRLIQAGVDPSELKVFEFADLGLNFPEDGIYARARTWREKPDLCRRFTQATLEGWRQAFAHPEQALKQVMRRVNEAHLPTNQTHQGWMLSVMREFITHRVGLEGIGQLSPQDLDFTNSVLLALGFMDQPVQEANFVAPAWRKP